LASRNDRAAGHPRRIVRHGVLTGGNSETKQSEMAIEVRVATVHRHTVDTILKRQLDGPAGSIATIRPS
jgi:hypothetical protein